MLYKSNSKLETENIAKAFAKTLKLGDVVCINGDLGAGKTAFTAGIAKGIGVTDIVSSPTFTIVQVYESGRMPLYHFDVYRIGDVSEMDEIGYEDYFFGDGVCVMEWADLVEPILPEEAVRITISKDLSKGADYRKIEIESQRDEDNSD